MEQTVLPIDLFTEEHLSATFYSSGGEIFSNSKIPFSVSNASSSWVLPQKKKLPLDVFFGDIKINQIKSETTSNGKNLRFLL